MRHGDYNAERRKAKDKLFDKRGYVWLHRPGHPLATSDGRVWEHRIVYYEQVSSNPTECAICQKPLSWETAHIDHIDENKWNNHKDNLRALCPPCNVYRSRRPEQSGSVFLEISGKRLSATAWTRQPGVKVSVKTILSRKKRGMSDFDAVFGERKQWRNHVNKTRHGKYDALRGLI